MATATALPPAAASASAPMTTGSSFSSGWRADTRRAVPTGRGDSGAARALRARPGPMPLGESASLATGQIAIGGTAGQAPKAVTPSSGAEPWRLANTAAVAAAGTQGPSKVAAAAVALPWPPLAGPGSGAAAGCCAAGRAAAEARDGVGTQAGGSGGVWAPSARPRGEELRGRATAAAGLPALQSGCRWLRCVRSGGCCRVCAFSGCPAAAASHHRAGGTSTVGLPATAAHAAAVAVSLGIERPAASSPSRWLPRGERSATRLVSHGLSYARRLTLAAATEPPSTAPPTEPGAHLGDNGPDCRERRVGGGCAGARPGLLARRVGLRSRSALAGPKGGPQRISAGAGGGTGGGAAAGRAR